MAKDKLGENDKPDWTGPTATKFDNKAYSEYFDPCQEAADKSIRAYRDCKKQWMEARAEAKRNKPWFS
ncbi:hypothetical protein E8E11_005862 [Didymella keratinophila]|nr:hypothetical protein E8E11_005862 [Didymella keratinophila]